jgi:hypothetical protein
MTPKRANNATAEANPISGLVASAPVLPGESAKMYAQGLSATLRELEAKTPL